MTNPLSSKEEIKYQDCLESILIYLNSKNGDYTKNICTFLKLKKVTLTRKILRTLWAKRYVTLVDEGCNWHRWYITELGKTKIAKLNEKNDI